MQPHAYISTDMYHKSYPTITNRVNFAFWHINSYRITHKGSEKQLFVRWPVYQLSRSPCVQYTEGLSK